MIEYIDHALQADIDYSFSCFDAYCSAFSVEKIPGTHVCEIGPGKNLAVSLLFKALGAEQVYVADKYLKPWKEDYHKPFYTLLAQVVQSRWPWADVQPIYDCAKARHAADGLHVLAEDAETLESIPDFSLDFIGSWAVLEHLYHPPRAFARMAKITKPGGAGLHQVDFRDHHDFSRPLEFLLYHFRWGTPVDEPAYAWMAQRLGRSAEQARREGLDADGLIRRICGYWGNSYRHTDYDNLWHNNGFEILEFTQNGKAEIDYMQEFIPRLQKMNHICLSHYSEEVLYCTSALYHVIKNS